MFDLRFVLSVLSLCIALPFAYAEEPQTVDINSADAWTLMYVLDGVGKKKAGAIVKYREENGCFETIYDLDDVPGIGPKTIMKNQDKIVVIIPETETGQAENPKEACKKSEENSEAKASAENQTEVVSNGSKDDSQTETSAENQTEDADNAAETPPTPTSNQTTE